MKTISQWFATGLWNKYRNGSKQLETSLASWHCPDVQAGSQRAFLVGRVIDQLEHHQTNRQGHVWQSCVPGIYTRSTSQHINTFTLVINYNPAVCETQKSFLSSRCKLFTAELLKSVTYKRWKISLKIIGLLASLWIKGLNKYPELAKIALKIYSSSPVYIAFARMVFLLWVLSNQNLKHFR